MLNNVSVLTIKGNGSANFAHNVRHLTLTNFCSNFTSLNNHKTLLGSNQIFHYSRCTTPKRVTSLRGTSPQLRSGNATPFKPQRWRTVGNTVFDLTSPRFELQTSRSRDKCVTVRPTGRSLLVTFSNFL